MTISEAIEILRDTPIDIRSTREDDIHTLYATAQNMAIEALSNSQNPSDSEVKTKADSVSEADVIYRQQAIDAVKTYWSKVVDDIPKGTSFEEVTQLCDMALEHNANILKAIDQLPSAQPDIIQCKDCYWWEKQEASLQGRCDRYGFYPTGYWYCAGARERKENG